MAISLQSLKRDLDDISWDLADKADALDDDGKHVSADYVRDAEELVMEAVDCLRDAAREIS